MSLFFNMNSLPKVCFVTHLKKKKKRNSMSEKNHFSQALHKLNLLYHSFFVQYHKYKSEWNQELFLYMLSTLPSVGQCCHMNCSLVYIRSFILIYIHCTMHLYRKTLATNFYSFDLIPTSMLRFINPNS